MVAVTGSLVEPMAVRPYHLPMPQPPRRQNLLLSDRSSAVSDSPALGQSERWVGWRTNGRFLAPRAMAAVLLTLTATAGAAAQQQFTLTDDDEWTAADNVDPTSPEGQLDEVRKRIAQKELNQAERLATRWIERHPRHGLLAEAYLLRGDALHAMGDHYEALFDYEFVCRSFPASEAFVPALERELEIARLYAGGKRRKFLGIRMLDGSDEAEELFIRVQERLPGSRLAEMAGMDLADFYFERRKMDLAAEAYKLFLENYSESDQVPKARRRLIYAHLASFKGPQFDASGLYEARTELRTLQVVDPIAADEIGASAILVRIDESDALKMLSTAMWYKRVGNYISAEFVIRRLLRTYPNSVAMSDALRGIDEIIDNLPDNVLAEAPDYKTLRAAMQARSVDERTEQNEGDR